MPTFEERYRRKPFLENPSPPVPAADVSPEEALKAAHADEYKPYNMLPHPEPELWIRPSKANASADVYLPYSYRNHMISDGSGFFISMHYSTPIIAVRIHGRNLQELVHLLSKRQIEWLMEFDPRAWPEVPQGAPCITGIEVVHGPRPVKKEDDELRSDAGKEPEVSAKH